MIWDETTFKDRQHDANRNQNDTLLKDLEPPKTYHIAHLYTVFQNGGKYIILLPICLLALVASF